MAVFSVEEGRGAKRHGGSPRFIENFENGNAEEGRGET